MKYNTQRSDPADTELRGYQSPRSQSNNSSDEDDARSCAHPCTPRFDVQGSRSNVQVKGSRFKVQGPSSRVKVQSPRFEVQLGLDGRRATLVQQQQQAAKSRWANLLAVLLPVRAPLLGGLRHARAIAGPELVIHAEASDHGCNDQKARLVRACHVLFDFG